MIHKPNTRYILISLFVLLLVISSTLAIYFYQQYNALKKDSNIAAQQEAVALTQKIGRFMELPNELPSVATITDKNKLNSQPFFANAENGDKLLVYTKAAEVILYRPSTNKIIGVAPISLQVTPQQSPAVSYIPIRVAIYNGSQRPGLAELMKTKLTKAINNLAITTGNAQKHDYQKTLVIRIRNINETLLTQISRLADGDISASLAGEIKPDADVLIIVGNQ